MADTTLAPSADETAAIRARRQHLRRARWRWLLFAVVVYALWDMVDQNILVPFDFILGGYAIDWSLIVVVGIVFTLGISRHQDRSLAQLEQQIARTVTAERAALQAQTAQAAARADALAAVERYKSALLAAVSHDFRTPLGIIATASDELLAEDVQWSPAATHDFARVIRTETERLNRLVINLLDLTLIEAGAIQLRRGWYSVPEIVHAVLHRFGPDLEDRPLRLDLPRELPLVPVDYVQIEQVVWNLVQNALKYAPPGSPLTIAAEVAGQALVLRVADAGPGIPPEERARVFEPFYRMQQGSASPVRGSGIGLAICKGLVEAHGGQMTIGDGADGGALVEVRLPLASVPDRPDETGGSNGATAHPGD